MLMHVDLVGTLFVVWGALTAVIGASMLALAVGAFALISSASRTGGGAQFAAGLTAAVFTALGKERDAAGVVRLAR